MDVAEWRANGQGRRNLGISSVLAGRRAKMLKAIPGSMGGGRKGVK